MNADYLDLFVTLLPEGALVFGALLVLGLDLAFFHRRSTEERLHFAVGTGVVALVVSGGLTLWVGHVDTVFGGALAIDSLAFATRLGVVVLTLLTLGVATGTPALRHPAEYVAIILFAAAGFMLMGSAQQLLVAFLAIELSSLSLYVLAGFDKTRPESAEAGLKYFLYGGMSAAFLLFGFSLLYGLTGSLELRGIAMAIAMQGMSPLLSVALVMVIVAFGFKAAAAPFHLWAPDTYQGAPAASAALIASASKLGGFALFTRLLWLHLGPVAGDATRVPGAAGWMTVVAILSAVSLLLGNLVALAQTDVRRLLAYSAIGHAGALLLGVIATDVMGPGPLYYYVATYGVATVGAFGVLAALEGAGVGSRIEDLAGLQRRSPLLAGCLAVFMLSLAGIPPLAGFFGKFAVFAAALQLNGLAGPVGMLTLLAILLSAVALYYYLVVLKQAFVAAGRPEAAPIRVPVPAVLSLLAAAALLVLLGVFPSLVLGFFES